VAVANEDVAAARADEDDLKSEADPLPRMAQGTAGCQANRWEVKKKENNEGHGEEEVEVEHGEEEVEYPELTMREWVMLRKRGIFTHTFKLRRPKDGEEEIHLNSEGIGEIHEGIGGPPPMPPAGSYLLVPHEYDRSASASKHWVSCGASTPSSRVPGDQDLAPGLQGTQLTTPSSRAAGDQDLAPGPPGTQRERLKQGTRKEMQAVKNPDRQEQPSPEYSRGGRDRAELHEEAPVRGVLIEKMF